MKKTDSTTLKRRSFLKGAAVSTIAVTGTAITGNAVADETESAPAKSSKGYKLTPHVKDYYRLARF